MIIDRKNDFADFEDHVWLNAASEGPLPSVAAQALNQAVTWKSHPYQLDFGKFTETVKSLKDSIGRLIGVSGRDVILGNSSSYGIHLLANGIPWASGDEICLMQNDFPTNILPWLALEDQGVVVHQCAPADRVLQPEELLTYLNDRTRLVCLSHVHTFSGVMLDVPRFAQLCRERGIIFVLNVSQSAGTMPLDIQGLNVDAVVCSAYKWLCGPYGTGFVWLQPELRQQLCINQAYWSAVMSAEELNHEGALTRKTGSSARVYDVFGTANFFNFMPLRASIDYILSLGPDQIHMYNQSLIDELLSLVDENLYHWISPMRGPFRSNLVVLSHQQASRNAELFDHLTAKGIYTALWKGNIRIAPHVYNTLEDIQQVSKVLNNFQ